MAITIQSDAFGFNQPISPKYVGQGKCLSPPLQWSGIPKSARQLVLVVEEEPGAANGELWVHWLIYNIPPNVKGLPEAVAATERPAEPTNTAQGTNSWGKVGYGGSPPPPGEGTHHCHFRLYALALDPTLEPGLKRDALVAAISDHILAEGELTGIYEGL